MTQKRAVAFGVSAALVLLLLAACVWASKVAFQTLGDAWRAHQDLAEGRRFPQELAAAEAEGLPTRMTDLQKPLPPPGQNAAPVYTRLMLLLKAHPFSASENAAMTLHTGGLPSSAQWAQMAGLMHDRADVMALVHQAASRPQCVFPRDWAKPDPADITFPELGTVRQAARLLELESLLMAHQGEPEQAVRNQALGFRVAHHGASDGTLIAYLVGVAVDAITLEGMKRIMTLAGPNAALDDTVGALIAHDWKPRPLSAALRTETAFDLGMIAYLRKAGPQGLVEETGDAHPTAGRQGVNSANWDAILDYNGVFLLGWMGRAIQAADGPYTDAHELSGRIDAQPTDKRHSARFLAAILAPSLSTAVEKRAQIQAVADVTRAGAAVLAQSARMGHPPDRLPLPVTDPYTGKPLGYRREGAQGFVIYSVGADGHFDGGKPGEYIWKPYQVAFRFPWAAPH